MASLTIDTTDLGKFSDLNADRFLKAVAETVIEEMRDSMRNTKTAPAPAYAFQWERAHVSRCSQAALVAQLA